MMKERFDISESSIYDKYSKKVTAEIIFFFVDYLAHMNYPFFISPYEADKQLCQLWQEKQVDYIISEDSDIIAYGCTNIIRGLRIDGSCYLMNSDSIKKLQGFVENYKNKNKVNY